jgi:hypothetical protein
LERALAIDEAVYGPEHPEFAITLINLGSVQQQARRARRVVRACGAGALDL